MGNRFLFRCTDYMVLAPCRYSSKEKKCDTRMILVWSETVNKAYNMDIMAMKSLKKQLDI